MTTSTIIAVPIAWILIRMCNPRPVPFDICAAAAMMITILTTKLELP